MDEKLIKTLDLIQVLAAKNKDFEAELQKLYGGTSSANTSLMGHECAINPTIIEENRLDEIYEICVEKVLYEQAKQFYKDFPIDDIKSSLIHDFVNMERFHRQDDFDFFCLSMYQQIECITNYLAKDMILNHVAEMMMGYPSYTNGSVNDRYEGSRKQIAGYLFWNDAITKASIPLSKLQAMDKVGCILYFICFQANLQSMDSREYREYKGLIYDLYQYRNTNHREGEKTNAQQKTYDRIGPKEKFYYFKFIGVLAWFVEKVSNGFPMSDELIAYAYSLSKRKIKEV